MPNDIPVDRFVTIMQGFKEVVAALVQYNRIVADYQMTVSTAILQIDGQLAKMNSKLDRVVTEKPRMPL